MKEKQKKGKKCGMKLTNFAVLLSRQYKPIMPWKKYLFYGVVNLLKKINIYLIKNVIVLIQITKILVNK
jgi:hypothetical protein